MSALKLDKAKPHGHIFGDTAGRHFEQDGRYFRQDGSLWVDPNAPKKKETNAEREARERAEAEEAARLEAEAKTAKGGDDQLSQQLGN